MLEALRARWGEAPSDRDLAAAVGVLAGDLARLGVFNMLLSDGRTLFCHCGTKLAWITRRAPFGPATLIDEDLTVNFAERTTPEDVVTVVATRPLTRDETWTRMEPRSFAAFRAGERVRVAGKPVSRSATGFAGAGPRFSPQWIQGKGDHAA